MKNWKVELTVGEVKKVEASFKDTVNRQSGLP